MKMRSVLAKMVLVLTICVFVTLAFGSVAKAADDSDVLQQFIESANSPLPWWTPYYFHIDHPDFDIAGYLAVAWCESSLGKGSMKYHNVGSIKGGPVGSVWRDLRIGTFGGGYNIYANFYDGQRAAIRLLYDKGYNSKLKSHDWWGFANRYYGSGVAGIGAYVANLQSAHSYIVRFAANRGVTW
jgi:hypothetical protein